MAIDFAGFNSIPFDMTRTVVLDADRISKVNCYVYILPFVIAAPFVRVAALYGYLWGWWDWLPLFYSVAF